MFSFYYATHYIFLLGIVLYRLMYYLFIYFNQIYSFFFSKLFHGRRFEISLHVLFMLSLCFCRYVCTLLILLRFFTITHCSLFVMCLFPLESVVSSAAAGTGTAES